MHLLIVWSHQIAYGNNILFFYNLGFHHLKTISNTTANAEEVSHSVIGFTLVLGFIFMLLVDQVASRHTTPVTYNVVLSDGMSNKFHNLDQLIVI